MTEDERKNDCTIETGGDRVDTGFYTGEGSKERLLENDSGQTPITEGQKAENDTGVDGSTDSAECGNTEIVQSLTALIEKVDFIFEETKKNKETLNGLTNGFPESGNEEPNHKRQAEIDSSIVSIEENIRQNSQKIEEIKAEALALHRLYQNDFAGRIRNLETELERYRKRDAGLAFDGIYKEIGQIYADFENLADEVEDERISGNIRLLFDEFKEFFISHGVELVKSKEGEKRNLSFSQVLKRLPTNKPELNGLVASSISSGFCIDKRCLIKEMVNVYRFEEMPNTLEHNEKEEESIADENGTLEAPATDSPTANVNETATEEALIVESIKEQDKGPESTDINSANNEATGEVARDENEAERREPGPEVTSNVEKEKKGEEPSETRKQRKWFLFKHR